MMNIPIANPGASYRALKSEIDGAVTSVLNSGWYILGSAVESFEKKFASYCSSKYAIGVANGTDADELALRAIGVKGGDKVATVANTANATVSAIERIGAVPVFVDVDLQSQNMDAEQLVLAIKRQRIAAVVAVHLFGHPADMQVLSAVAREYGIPTVEDCAQAHGAEVNNCRVGSLADVSAFSFYPTKNLGALGDGGAITTSSDKLADMVRMLRQYGWRSRYSSEVKGMNSRLDELQASILSVKLNFLDEATDRRRSIAMRYNKAFAGLPLGMPVEKEGYRHVYHQYVIQVQDGRRDELASFLKSRGVGTAILYPIPIHKQPAYQKEFAHVSLPNTETLARTILSLPVYPELSDEEVMYVIDSVIAFYS